MSGMTDLSSLIERVTERQQRVLHLDAKYAHDRTFILYCLAEILKTLTALQEKSNG